MIDDDTLREGTRAHYEDGAYYEQAYRRRRDDVRFYANLAEEHGEGGRVLELGCGSGRVTREIARRGVEVVGVDLVQAMLDHAAARLLKEPKRVRERIRLVRGDLRSVRLEERFDLVVSPFNVFMHLYARRDVERALETVRAHLERGALFVFDVLMPYPEMLSRDPARVYKVGKVKRGGREYHYRERFEYDPVRQVQQTDLAFVGVDDPADFHLTPLTQRQFFPAELEALLHYNGFAIVERFGDFERRPMDDDADSQILVCRPRRR